MKKILQAFLICFFFISTAQSAEALLLFGGDNHDKFLGCINCSDMSPDSIWNDLGKYGNDLSRDSIWNDLGPYGSDLSSYSPWNDLASNPPIIVDRNGRSYGYLTTNDLKSQSQLELAQILIRYHKEIQKDVSKWYNKIF